MLATYTWLKEFIDTGLPVEKLSHALTMAGLEIEGLTETSNGDVVMDVAGPGESGDYVFEVNVTPNRPDWLSMLGIARELAAITGKPLTMPKADIPNGRKSDFTVTIDDPALCRRYAARIVRGVKLGPSPAWISARLEHCGIRSINNIVDITNYVLLELGHPLHAFDLATLRGKTIRVGVAGKNNSLTTLDGQERKLPEDALLIWDGERPVAVAGVMGGADTEVSEGTTDILIESAWFLPQSVRRTSKVLGLKTEAAYRFERGTDLVLLEQALDRAASLVAELAGGTVEALIDTCPAPFEPAPFTVSYRSIHKLIGIEIAKDEILSILKRLQLEPEDKGDAVAVTPPSYRPDLTMEADIAEEVARIYGFDRIPTQPPVAEITTKGRNQRRLLTALVHEAMRKEGFHEAINYSFMNASHLDTLGLPADDERRQSVVVLNPLRQEDAHMRTTLVPSLLGNFVYNVSRGVREVRLFEISKVFIKTTKKAPTSKTLPREPFRLGGVLYAEKAPALYPDTAQGFYQIKGAVEVVLDCLKIKGARFEPSTEPFLHPGKAADLFIGKKRLGFLGVMSPQVVTAFDVKTKHEVMLFELDLDALFEAVPERVEYRAIPRYPAVERDIAILLDRQITAAQVIEYINAVQSPLVEDISVFDSYEGKGIPEGKKSVGVNVRYRSAERTLTDEEVEQAHQGIIGHLQKRTGGEIRGA